MYGNKEGNSIKERKQKKKIEGNEERNKKKDILRIGSRIYMEMIRVHMMDQEDETRSV